MGGDGGFAGWVEGLIKAAEGNDEEEGEDDGEDQSED